MVDTISNAKGIRHTGSATSRYGASSATTPAPGHRAVAPVSEMGGTGHREPGEHNEQNPHREAAAQAEGSGLRLEVNEAEDGQALVYRFVDLQSGDVVREYAADEFGRMRDYLRDKKIRLLDKKI